MNFSMPPITWICLAIILVAFIVCFVLVQKFKNSDKLVENRRIVEYFPTFISTLGVLGTFFGITMGLMAFDTTDLDKSIPGLLDGLKTAFFTSLAGMIGSMILSAFIGRKQDEKDGGISDINQAAGTICQAVKQMSDLNKSTIEKLASQMEEQEKDRKAFYSTMGSVMESVKKTQASISESLLSINKSQSAVESEMHSVVINQRSQNEVLFEATDSMINSIGRLEENSTTQTSHLAATQKSIVEIAEFTHHIPDLVDLVEGIVGTQEEINAQVQKLKIILDGEVLQIEESMDKTNQLLERKFDEFTELLKKSNTEALVEVMKKVTEEFQKQMNSLINKLIQENFDQLNRSVERLNQWQQENKEMISSLTQQYKQMATNFEEHLIHLIKLKMIQKLSFQKEENSARLLTHLTKSLSMMNASSRQPNFFRKPQNCLNPTWSPLVHLQKLSTHGYANSGTLWMALLSLSINWRKSQKSRTTVRSSGREQRKTWKKVSA